MIFNFDVKVYTPDILPKQVRQRLGAFQFAENKTSCLKASLENALDARQICVHASKEVMLGKRP